MAYFKNNAVMSPEEALASFTHASEVAWSNYSESDYTVEQWHAACLIHQHEGAPTSKNQCKLPVRTPAGVVNRHGVQAAAAALAGARGGVNASESEKTSAEKSLVRLYGELGMDLPSSLKHDSLAHYGKKGMKWGVVNEDDSTGNSPSAGVTPAKSSSSNSGVDKKLLAKRVAIGAGILGVAAGAGYVAYKMNQSGSLPLSSLKDSSSAASGKQAVQNILKEPTSVIHASRGKSMGYRFLKQGGLPDALHEYDLSGLQDSPGREFFNRYGDNMEKVAAKFLDPEGRTDQATRPIIHEVIVPKIMAAGLNSVEDVKNKVWPLLKPDYDAYYTKLTPAEEHMRRLNDA